MRGTKEETVTQDSVSLQTLVEVRPAPRTPAQLQRAGAPQVSLLCAWISTRPIGAGRLLIVGCAKGGHWAKGSLSAICANPRSPACHTPPHRNKLLRQGPGGPAESPHSSLRGSWKALDFRSVWGCGWSRSQEPPASSVNLPEVIL